MVARIGERPNNKESPVTIIGKHWKSIALAAFIGVAGAAAATTPAAASWHHGHCYRTCVANNSYRYRVAYNNYPVAYNSGWYHRERFRNARWRGREGLRWRHRRHERNWR